ncbi:MAG: DUF192 domain-containing protein [Treponema sp.]|nr:DUF192 domain-containing protein [Treponema sp.]
MMKKKYVFLIFLMSVSLFFSISCKRNKLRKDTLTIRTQAGISYLLNVEIADTQESRQKGYMGRRIIPQGTGMLFVFNKDQVLSFWMKNTPHPLSIAYIDSKGKIRNIYDMTPYSLSSIVSTGSVRYALEVPQGWFEKNCIKEGDSIDLSILNLK